jgi:hypothetical protein
LVEGRKGKREEEKRQKDRKTENERQARKPDSENVFASTYSNSRDAEKTPDICI